MQTPKKIVLITLIPFLVGFFSACLPLALVVDNLSTPTYTPVSLPPTWTEVPPTETILPPDTPAPTETEHVLETHQAVESSPTPSLSSELVPFKEISMINPQEGWAWSYPDFQDVRIWRTSDGGLSWYDVSPDPKGTDYVFALDGLTAWAVACETAGDDCESRLVRTIDGGQNWSILSEAKYYSYWSADFTSQDKGLRTQYDVAAGSGFWTFYETIDGGSSWDLVEIISEPLGGELNFGYQFQTCNLCGELLYIDHELLINVDGNLSVQPKETIPLWISLDRGASWLDQELEFPKEEYKPGVYHPNRPLFFDDQTGILPINLAPWREDNSDMVFYSTTNGLNWQFLSIVEDVGSVNSWNQFDYLNTGEIFFDCGSDLCVSRDKARTWERISSNLSYNYSEIKPKITQFDFVDGQNGYALVGPTYGPYSLWQTSDGGRNWILLTPDLFPK
jgi:photosystem II stability/assembly factor-like uncharacterized protein